MTPSHAKLALPEKARSSHGAPAAAAAMQATPSSHSMRKGTPPWACAEGGSCCTSAPPEKAPAVSAPLVRGVTNDTRAAAPVASESPNTQSARRAMARYGK